LFDESDWEYAPDVILTGLECRLKDISALVHWKNSSSDLLRIMNQMKRLYIKKQLEEMKKLGIHQLDFEINCIPEEVYIFDQNVEAILQKRDDGLVALFEMPFDANGTGSIGKVRFKFKISVSFDSVESVSPTIIWPSSEPPFAFKTPKFEKNSSMIEYISGLQLIINKKLRKNIRSNLQREQFITQMISHFNDFVLEYDETEFLYLSFYIFMSAPSEDPTRGTEDILGATVINGITF
jgi:hypothetical protein